jgi:hypothetical protein
VSALSLITLGVFLVLAACAWRVFTGCRHKWTVEQIINVFDPDSLSERPVSKRYVLVCEHCGTLRKKEVE